MFGFLRRNKSEELDEVIDDVYMRMRVVGPDSEEYKELLSHLERLTKLKPQTGLRRVSPDTMAVVAGNLAGIVIIVAYEHKHVVTSKALGFILKTKP